MADERNTHRKWSLEEIDELLQDSGMLPRDGDSVVDLEDVAPTPKAAPFNPRPARNDNIEHQIKTQTVERSDSVAEPQVYGNFVSEKYRERFFNKPVQNLEKTSEHAAIPPEEQRYERSGFVKKKSSFESTNEFSPVPNLVPDHKLEGRTASGKTIVFDDKKHTRTIGLRSLAVTDGDAHDVELPNEDDGAQLSFEGFNTDEDVDIVDEKEVEAELMKKRRQKVESFTMTGETETPAEDEPQKRYGTDEYRTQDDKFKVAYYLKKKKNTALAGTVVCALCSVALVVLSLIAKNLASGGKVYLIISIALSLLASGVNFSELVDSFKSIIKLKFDRFSGSVLAIFVSVIQCLVLLFSDVPFENGVSMFCGAAVFALGLNIAGEYYEYKRIIRNFTYLASSDEIYAISPIEKSEVAYEIGRGLLLDSPSVLSSQRTLFPDRFVELSRKGYPSDEISRKLVPIGFAASVAVGFVTLLVSKDIRNAVTAMSGCFCLSVPYFACLTDSIAIGKVSKKMRKKGGVLTGWQSYNECESANAIAVDSADIFDKDGGNVFGIHPFYDIEIDRAIIYTASLLVASGGPLGNLFKRVIVDDVSLLPPVDTLAYEDKLGLSAWIFNRRVLVGSKELLRNHNVEIPDIALVERHLFEGRYPLYLAIDGKAAAAFIISYDVDDENARLLKTIESDSITVLVRSDDANITDEMVSKKLLLPQSGVKVLSAVSGDLYKRYVKETTSAADSLLIHDGRAYSFLYAVKSALSLGTFKQVLKVFQSCAMGIGIALVAVLSFASGLAHLNCLQLIITQILFTAVTVAVVSGSNFIKNFERRRK